MAMKKVLVLILTLCIAFNASVEAKAKKTTKAVKKTERAMTEFEQWQKEEYLNYLLVQCEYYYEMSKRPYKDAKSATNEAEKYKREYEETEVKNYYVDLTKFDQEFYNGGYSFTIFIFGDGRVETVGYDYIGDITHTTPSGQNKEYQKKKGLALELVEKIKEQVSDRVQHYEEKNEEVIRFLNKHNIETTTQYDRFMHNNKAWKKHKEEAYGKYYK